MSRNVPKLRFKGFEDEWKEYRLGDFLDFYSTNSLSRDCLNSEDGEVQNIHYGDIHMKFPTILDIQKYDLPFINSDIDISKIKDDSFCRDGDIVIADASENYDDIGKSIEVENISNNKVVAGLHTILCRDNKNMTANGFKGYMLSNEYIRKQIKVLAVGTKVLGISKTNLSTIKTNMPSLQEQEKIANFLSKLDSIIEKQEKKVEYWNLYKKGMMQKIFKQEIRFKDDKGLDYPEWKKMTLGDVDVELTRGPFGSALKKEFMVDKGIETYKVYEQKHAIQKNIKIGEYYINKEKYNKLKRFKVNPGDFIMSCSGTVGELFKIPNNAEKGVINQALLKIEVGSKVNEEYFLYCFRKNLDGLETKGSGIKNITSVKFLKEEFIMPIPFLKEQEKIGDFFVKIDAILDKEYKKLEELKHLKKGLLQQIFI
ncbi:restriction endonuclease subunit S [Clostridium perfringens]|uniref:restriction endonuclease subunit S n=1 Tax=Clostridium perfringens TaxID=1502 RepID=UPI0018E40404|nr:restriction endonuclease subunit S [Clostridium perfringens]MBI6054282.1 restriction endonuclease subunit S [Clostridium perfringens]